MLVRITDFLMKSLTDNKTAAIQIPEDLAVDI